jgi:serine/threonine-protein kinase
VVLWELLTGRRLFFGESDADSLRRVLNEDVPAPSSVVPDLPLALAEVVMRGIERDPATRYATAHDMALELGACATAASPAQIGAWVELTAAVELNERASRISAIERTASAAESLSRLTPTPPGNGAPDSPTPVGRRLQETTTGVGTARLSPVAPEKSQVVPRREAGWPRAVQLSLAVGAAVLAVTVAAVLVGVAQHKDAPQSVRAAAEWTPPSAAAEPAPAPSDAPIPVSADDDGPPVPAPSSKPIPRWSYGRTWPGASQPAVVKPATLPATAPATRPGCDPPYTEDAQHHIHFKPSCM